MVGLAAPYARVASPAVTTTDRVVIVAVPVAVAVFVASAESTTAAVTVKIPGVA